MCVCVCRLVPVFRAGAKNAEIRVCVCVCVCVRVCVCVCVCESAPGVPKVLYFTVSEAPGVPPKGEHIYCCASPRKRNIDFRSRYVWVFVRVLTAKTTIGKSRCVYVQSVCVFCAIRVYVCVKSVFVCVKLWRSIGSFTVPGFFYNTHDVDNAT